MITDPYAVTAKLSELDTSPAELAAMLAGAMKQVAAHNAVVRDPLVVTRARAVDGRRA
jgi:hypothetical protein